MVIKILKRAEIDIVKWDACIQNAKTSNLYACAWYLDIMTEKKWQAIVYGNYDVCFPFLLKWKWFIPYIVQPALCQRLGIYSLYDSEVDVIYKQLLKLCFKVNICISDRAPSFFVHKRRQNHILDLQKPYELLYHNYNRNTKRNIAHSKSLGLKLEFVLDVDEVYLFLSNYDVTAYLKKNDRIVKSLVQTSMMEHGAFVVSAKHGESTVAMAYFMAYGNRLYFLLCASSEVGKATKAMYFLLDEVIRMYSHRPMILDFTGSILPSIARRNVGFGAQEEIYHQISWTLFNPFSNVK